jgi:hypothetical protein
MLRAMIRFSGGLATLLMVGLLVVPAVTAEDKKAAEPPKGATVLFDGKDLSGWTNRKGDPAPWLLKNSEIECVPNKGDIRTKDTFGPDFQLHVEFWLPLMADQKGQGRANSGVYLQGRYEIQVLDSYMNETYQNGSVGALYGILEPNKEAQAKAVKPPEQWNTYDITFKAPRVDEAGKVTTKGYVKVVLNGIAITEGEFDKMTGGSWDDKMTNSPGPIRLQDHGNKIRFRNIWIKPLS